MTVEKNVDVGALKAKLTAYRARRDALKQEQARLEERLSSSKEQRETSEKRLLELTGVKTLEEAEKKAAVIYEQIETAVNAIDVKMAEAGVV